MSLDDKINEKPEDDSESSIHIVVKVLGPKKIPDPENRIKLLKLMVGSTLEFLKQPKISDSDFNVMFNLQWAILKREDEKCIPSEEFCPPEDIGSLEELIKDKEPIFAVIQPRIYGMTLDKLFSLTSKHQGKDYFDSFQNLIIKKVINGLIYFQNNPTPTQLKLEEKPDYTKKITEVYDFFYKRFLERWSIEVEKYKDVFKILGKIGSFLDSKANYFFLDLNLSNILIELDRSTDHLLRALGGEASRKFIRDDIKKVCQENNIHESDYIITAIGKGGFKDIGADQEDLMELYSNQLYFIDLNQINKKRVISEDIFMLLDSPFIIKQKENFEKYFLEKYKEVTGKDIEKEYIEVKNFIEFYRNLRSAFHYLIGKASSEAVKGIKMAAYHLSQSEEAINREIVIKRSKELFLPVDLLLLRAWTNNFAYLLNQEVKSSPVELKTEKVSWNFSRENLSPDLVDRLDTIHKKLSEKDYDSAKKDLKEFEDRLNAADCVYLGRSFRDVGLWEDAIVILKKGSELVAEDHRKKHFYSDMGYCYKQLAKDKTPPGHLYNEESLSYYKKAIFYLHSSIEGKVDLRIGSISILNLLKCFLETRSLKNAEVLLNHIETNEAVKSGIMTYGLNGALEDIKIEYAALKSIKGGFTKP